ncbi:MAG: type I-E CRISPR-associated protein Cse1/CasA [Alphaproteobacteria bacterium]|nr:type I-E CRISPR-associated protein Cse1/CasA [Alphaproteobacteria bacterium]
MIRAVPGGAMTLPGVLAALGRDEIDSFPALRPHQEPAWHMLLVQLAALALAEGRSDAIPRTEPAWTAALRALTSAYELDEPWHLATEDWSRPAFLQPPVPDGVTLKNEVASPDGLDLLITARNHDLKQTIGRNNSPEDWLFALVSLQTGDGYAGSGNQGIARMNGGSSSRVTLSLAPLPGDGHPTMSPRLGARFRRDVAVLLRTREEQIKTHDHLEFPATGGLGLTWLAPWPEGRQLHLRELDIWFVEVCRRIRLVHDGGALRGCKGNSKATRIDAKRLHGAVGDPFAPVHKTDGKSLTLAGRDFDYRLLTELLLSGNWELPLLARTAAAEQDGRPMLLVAQALARGNSKTEGFKSRILPLGGSALRALGAYRKPLHELASQQMQEIDVFNKALGYGLALAAAGGDGDRIRKEHYVHARAAQNRFNRGVDSLFFEHLWHRLEAQDRDHEALRDAQGAFIATLSNAATGIFDAALATGPRTGIFRARAEVRARRSFHGQILHHFPKASATLKKEAPADAAQ